MNVNNIEIEKVTEEKAAASEAVKDEGFSIAMSGTDIEAEEEMLKNGISGKYRESEEEVSK